MKTFAKNSSPRETSRWISNHFRILHDISACNLGVISRPVNMRLYELILTKTFVKPGVCGLKLLRMLPLIFRDRAGEGSGGVPPPHPPTHTHILYEMKKGYQISLSFSFIK